MRWKLTLLSAAIVFFTNEKALSQNTSPYWSLAGNSNATTSSKLGTTNAIPLRILTNNVERIRILTNGNVGIGTTAASQKLHVVGNGYFTGNLGLGTSAPAQKLHVVGNTYITGNLGVGTSAPGGKLHVVGNAIISGRLGIGGSSSPNYALNLNATASIGGLNVPNAYSNYIMFGTKNGTGPGIFIYSSSNQNTSATVYGYNAGLGYGVMGYIPGLTGGPSDPNAPAGIYGYNAGYGYGAGGYCENGSGVFGYSKYYVGVWGSTGNTNSWAGYFNGRVFSTGGFVSSDKSLKKNISEVKSAMGIINQLLPKLYEFRQDGNYKLMNLPEGQHYGFLAQDIEQVLPNLVQQADIETKMLHAAGKPDKDGNQVPNNIPNEKISFKAVNYVELIPVVVGGMKELSNENQELRKQLEEQQKQIDDLKQMIQSLKQGAVTVLNPDGYLKQNAPNPFNDNSMIGYYAPLDASTVQVVISDMQGRVLKTYNGSKGNGQVLIGRKTLPAGTYNYSLIVNSKTVDSKKMVIN